MSVEQYCKAPRREEEFTKRLPLVVVAALLAAATVNAAEVLQRSASAADANRHGLELISE